MTDQHDAQTMTPEEYLRAYFPGMLPDVPAAAQALVRDTREMPWRERAAYWDMQQRLLFLDKFGSAAFDDLIYRRERYYRPNDGLSITEAMSRFAALARARIAAALIILDQGAIPLVTDPRQALTFLISGHPDYIDRGARWFQKRDPAGVTPLLSELIGFSMIALAASVGQPDEPESFEHAARGALQQVSAAMVERPTTAMH